MLGTQSVTNNNVIIFEFETEYTGNYTVSIWIPSMEDYNIPEVFVPYAIAAT